MKDKRSAAALEGEYAPVWRFVAKVLARKLDIVRRDGAAEDVEIVDYHRRGL